MKEAKLVLRDLIHEDASISKWRERAIYERANREWLRKSAMIAVRILDALEAKGMTKADLAVKMNLPLQRINEIVKGRENLAPETVLALEIALGDALQ